MKTINMFMVGTSVLDADGVYSSGSFIPDMFTIA